MVTAGAPPRGPARADRGWPSPELDLASILWFFGVVVGAAASIVILDKIPQSRSDLWEFLAALGLLAVYALAGLVLRATGWRVPAGLAATAAAAMVPAAGYGFTQLIGVYPDDPFFEPFANYSGALFAVGCATVVAAGLAYALTRVSFPLLLAAGGVQVTGQLLVPKWHATDDGRAMTAILIGAALVVVGLLSEARGLRRESFWLYVAGLGGIAAALVYFSFSSDNAGTQGWLPMLIAGTLVLLAAALLRRRVFAAFGAAGVGGALIHYLTTNGDWFAWFLLGLAVATFAAGLLVYPWSRRVVDVGSEPA